MFNLNLISSSTGSNVALQSPTISCENFDLFKVISKHLVDDYVTDSPGHTISKGEAYFIGCNFEKSGKETKTDIVYQQSNDFTDVIVHPNEVFATNVDFNGKFSGTSVSTSHYVELY